MEDKEILAEILTWKGTRWRHMQAVKGEGVDCVQFPVMVAKNLGWVSDDYKTIKYSRDWATHNDFSVLTRELETLLEAVPLSGDVISCTDDLRFGDVLALKMERCVGHLGMYIGNKQIVHVHIRRGVIIEPISLYAKQLHSAWRFKR